MEKNPYLKLDEYFSLHKITPVIIIEKIEEYSKVKRQVILYTLTEWAAKTQNGLFLIGIVDDLNFESQLEKRVKSRFGSNSFHFFENNYDDLCKVLGKRMPI